MTFLEILQDCYDRTGQGQTPPTEVSRRFKRFINRWQRKILTSNGMEPLRRVLLTQASVVDQAVYGIAVQSIRYISRADNERRLKEQTLGWYREHFPDPVSVSGTPLYYVPMGFGRVHTRPTVPSELFVKSTSASDVSPTIAYVEVVRSDGYKRLLSVALTGVTAVTLSAAITDVVDVLDFYLAVAAVGTVTLHQTSGAGIELSRIPIGGTVSRFYRYALVPTPSSVISYTIDGVAALSDMVQDTDEPFPNPDFHDLLVDGAVHDEWKSRGRSADANELRIEIEKRLSDLRGSILEWPDATRERGRSFEETIHLPAG